MLRSGLLLVLLFAGQLKAQEWDIQAHGLVSHAVWRKPRPLLNVEDELLRKTHLGVGLSLNRLYYDRVFPSASLYTFGFNYLFPVKQTLSLRVNNGSWIQEQEVEVTQDVRTLFFRYGYEIPQSFNPDLFCFAAFAMGSTWVNRSYDVPDGHVVEGTEGAALRSSLMELGAELGAFYTKGQVRFHAGVTPVYYFGYTSRKVRVDYKLGVSYNFLGY